MNEDKNQTLSDKIQEYFEKARKFYEKEMEKYSKRNAVDCQSASYLEMVAILENLNGGYKANFRSKIQNFSDRFAEQFAAYMQSYRISDELLDFKAKVGKYEGYVNYNLLTNRMDSFALNSVYFYAELLKVLKQYMSIIEERDAKIIAYQEATGRHFKVNKGVEVADKRKKFLGIIPLKQTYHKEQVEFNAKELEVNRERDVDKLKMQYAKGKISRENYDEGIEAINYLYNQRIKEVSIKSFQEDNISECEK